MIMLLKKIGNILPSLNLTCGAFSRNLCASVSPKGAAATKIRLMEFKCSGLTSSLFAKKETTGGAKCKMCGWKKVMLLSYYKTLLMIYNF